MSTSPNYRGLFVGLMTWDLVYLAPHFPKSDEKLVAVDATFAAGGPATNAAVCFSYLGNDARVMGSLGQHPIAHLIRSDLESYQVAITDLTPDLTTPPPVSSIIVTAKTGDRAVISLNATRTASRASALPPNFLENIHIILIDGHQMAVAAAISSLANAQNIPIVIDGGSWKPGFEQILPLADFVICSANFFPPGCDHHAAVFAYLSDLGIPHIAITQGELPILYRSHGEAGLVAVPQINPVDTLGAGDIFHGAFCYYILQLDFPRALAAAAQVAARSCEFFGTRSSMKAATNTHPETEVF